MYSTNFRRLIFATAWCLSGAAAMADVKMPAIFGDHMVLQRDLGVPFWGTAEPGEEVTVAAGGDQAQTKAGPDGKWSLKLGKLKASAEPIEVTVTGKNKIVFKDVLVGDVWVCSGQSNMEFGIKSFMTPDELAKAEEPQIRMFMVPKWVARAPGSDIAPAPAKCPTIGTWQVCNPKNLASNGEWTGFPAVGFYFGRQIHKFTGQPVGLIGTTWGGTRINSWMSVESLQAEPAFRSYAAGALDFRDNYEKIKSDYEARYAAWQAEMAKWNAENKDAIAEAKVVMENWNRAKKEADAAHQPPPPRPKELKPPQEPRDVINNNQISSALFNGMVAPLIPYGIKGAIWYQGESNGDQPGFYKLALPAMITDWRKLWNQGDFPFLVVQLPNYMARKPEPAESTWAGVREAQAAASSLPKVGYAVTIDLGDAGNIHPPDKYDVAARLALVAQRVAYDDLQTVTSGPTFKKAEIEGNTVRLSFDHLGGGLAIGVPPERFFATLKKPQPSPGQELEGFAVAGSDLKYSWAKAKIDGDTVIVSSEKVPNPVTVRYAWADNPAANLYNKEGLPAAPFRTDTVPFTK